MNILTAIIAVIKVTSDLAATLNSTGNVAAAAIIKATISVVSMRLIDSEMPCNWEKVKDALELETTRNKKVQSRVSDITTMASHVKKLEERVNASIHVKMIAAFEEVCTTVNCKFGTNATYS